LPAGTKDKFDEAMAAIPMDKRVAWRYHHVAPGDTLDSIARHYHANPSAIRQINNLQDEDLRADSKIVIPVTAGKTAGPAQVAYSHTPTRYKVRHGDTVLSVADDFGVPPERLRRWNRLKGDRLAQGKLLVIYRPVSPRQEAVINTPSRHAKARHSSSGQASKSHSSTQTAQTSTHKSSVHTASKSGSGKTATAKDHGANGSRSPASGTSERASAGLR
jgi:membrane-bound lytic murein transglycosylase D